MEIIKCLGTAGDHRHIGDVSTENVELNHEVYITCHVDMDRLVTGRGVPISVLIELMVNGEISSSPDDCVSVSFEEHISLSYLFPENRLIDMYSFWSHEYVEEESSELFSIIKTILETLISKQSRIVFSRSVDDQVDVAFWCGTRKFEDWFPNDQVGKFFSLVY